MAPRSREPVCQLCLSQSLGRHILQQSSYGDWACPSCGFIDEKVTHASNTVDVTLSRGAVLNEDETMGTKEDAWVSWSEANFMKGVDRLLQIYLVFPETCLTARPCPQLVAAAKRCYLRLRDADAELAGHKTKLLNPEARKLRYHLATVIKMTVQQNNLEFLSRKSGGMLQEGISGGVIGDGIISIPTLSELVERGRRLGVGHEGYFDTSSGLILTQRRYAKIMRWNFTNKDSVLTEVSIVMNELQRLASIPHEDRVKVLRTKPPKREWEATDWEYLEKIDWEQAFACAIGLFQAQECVKLWPGKCSPSVAIALAIMAIQATTGAVMPQIQLIACEIGSAYGISYATPAEKLGELKKLVVAWSTTFPEAGIQIPHLSLPRRGIIGDGLHYYQSDFRKAVPELEIAALAAQVIAKDWRKVMYARLRLNAPVRPYDTQLVKARMMFAAAAPQGLRKARKIRDQVNSGSGERTATDSPGDSAGGTSTLRSGSVESRSGTPCSVISSTTSLSSYHVQTPVIRGRRRIDAKRPSAPMPVLSSIDTSNSHQNVIDRSVNGKSNNYALSRLDPDMDLETMLANAEHSSDEDYGRDSDDEDFGGQVSQGQGLELSFSDVQRSVIGFSIGPNGFSTEIGKAPTTAPSGNGDDLASPTTPVNLRKRSIDSASIEADTERASEVERTLKRPRENHHTNTVGNQASETIHSNRAQVLGVHQNPATRNNHRAIHPSLNLNSPSGSRSVLTAGSPSTNGGSVAMSRTSSTQSNQSAPSPLVSLQSPTPEVIPEHSDNSDSHIGCLVKERPTYVVFRPGLYRSGGQMVSKEVERAMLRWIARQRINGSIPRQITPSYLEGIGIKGGDIRGVDLVDYVEKHRDHWSPVESLLRAGVSPMEIPPHYLVHSLISLDILLNHYDDREKLIGNGQPERLSGGQGKNTNLDDKEELEFLFGNGDETFEDCFLNEKDREARKQQILDAGTWGDENSEFDTGKGERHAQTLLQRLVAIGGIMDEDEAAEKIQEAIVNRFSENTRKSRGARSNTKRGGVHDSVKMPTLWDEEEDDLVDLDLDDVEYDEGDENEVDYEEVNGKGKGKEKSKASVKAKSRARSSAKSASSRS